MPESLLSKAEQEPDLAKRRHYLDILHTHPMTDDEAKRFQALAEETRQHLHKLATGTLLART